MKFDKDVFYRVVIVLCLFSIVYVAFWFFIQLDTIRVSVKYHEAIDSMPIDVLKNLRVLSHTEKAALYENLNFPVIFSADQAVQYIKEIQNPQVVVWFTDHVGDIKMNGLRWYQNNIFMPLINKKDICYWCVDLTAWRYLSLSDAYLREFDDYKAFVQLHNNGQKLSPAQCPVIVDCSNSLSNEIHIGAFKAMALRVHNFFSWLLCLPGSVSQLSGNLVNAHCRTDYRSGVSRFSLSDIGFTAPFLNEYAAKWATSIIHMDHSQVFPLLQYLEALYYVHSIVEACGISEKSAELCTIIFLLPNKEFTYYITKGEKRHFDVFRDNVREIMMKYSTINIRNIAIHFVPFAYGSDFYASPFDEAGDSVKNQQELSNIISNFVKEGTKI